MTGWAGFWIGCGMVALALSAESIVDKVLYHLERRKS